MLHKRKNTLIVTLLIITFLTSFSSSVIAYDLDFDDFTEVSVEDSDIIPYDSEVGFHEIDLNNEAYLYYDFGDDYFENFTHTYSYRYLIVASNHDINTGTSDGISGYIKNMDLTGGSGGGSEEEPEAPEWFEESDDQEYLIEVENPVTGEMINLVPIPWDWTQAQKITVIWILWILVFLLLGAINEQRRTVNKVKEKDRKGLIVFDY